MGCFAWVRVWMGIWLSMLFTTAVSGQAGSRIPMTIETPSKHQFVIDQRIAEGGWGVVFEALRVKKDGSFDDTKFAFKWIRSAPEISDEMNPQEIQAAKNQGRIIDSILARNKRFYQFCVTEMNKGCPRTLLVPHYVGSVKVEWTNGKKTTERGTIMYRGRASLEGINKFRMLTVIEPIPKLAGGAYPDDYEIQFHQDIEDRMAYLTTLYQNLIEGTSYLNKAGKLHKDINAGAVIFFDERVALGDFDTFGEPPKTTSLSKEYAPPEVLIRKRLDLTSDLFSFGVLMFETMFGFNPWATRLSGPLGQEFFTGAWPEDEVQMIIDTMFYGKSSVFKPSYFCKLSQSLRKKIKNGTLDKSVQSQLLALFDNIISLMDLDPALRQATVPLVTGYPNYESYEKLLDKYESFAGK